MTIFVGNSEYGGLSLGCFELQYETERSGGNRVARGMDRERGAWLSPSALDYLPVLGCISNIESGSE